MRPKVLLMAEAANPQQVSVPLIGWKLFRALAEVGDVHLVTQIRNQEALLEAGLAGDAFTAIDSERVARPLYRLGERIRGGSGKGWTTVAALSVLAYYHFENLVWRVFEERLRGGAFDLVHRVTPLSPTRPSLMARRCARIGVPFVLGPLNGGLPWMRSFGSRRRAEREWLSYVRGAYRLLPGYRSTRSCSSAIVVGSRHTAEEIAARHRERSVYVPENAVDAGDGPVPPRAPAGRPLRVAFVGRLVPYKGADMLLDAIAPLVLRQRAVLDIIGDGPEMERLRRRAAAAGIEAGVTWSGWIDHARVQERLARADVFAFPSIREFGGAVVLEAMALGLVPVVVDYGGPAEFVTPSTGYSVPMGPRGRIVSGFRLVLDRLAQDPGRIRDIGRRARRRVLTYFTWPAKAQQILEVYRWVLGERAAKPDFGMPFPDLVLEEAPPEIAADGARSAASRAAPGAKAAEGG